MTDPDGADSPSVWDRARAAARRAAAEARAVADEVREQWDLEDGLQRAQAMATDASERTSRVRDEAGQVISALATLPAGCDGADDLVARFVALLGPAVGVLDRSADSMSVGQLTTAGVGLHRITGVEVTYVRRGAEQAQLRCGRLSGRLMRLSADASTAAFVASTYGRRTALRAPMHRRGADAQLVVANGSLFVTTSPGFSGRAAGWLGGLNAGLGIGVPLLSDLAVYEIRETTAMAYDLDETAEARIEALLAAAVDRHRLRRMATRLATG